MTIRPPATRSTDVDVTSVHRSLAPVETLVGERRALYRLALELAGPAAEPVPTALLDHPVARRRLWEVLAGGAAVDPAELVGLCSSATGEPPVVSDADEAASLAGALAHVGATIGDIPSNAAPMELLTSADGGAFTRARATVVAGVALGRAIDPGLFGDLLAHVVMLGIVRGTTAGGLVSASSREYPGLVLIEEPTSAIQVAEALVHEGAHQKLFDLEITRDLLNAASAGCPDFQPPWRRPTVRWPVEQVLAAGHAYACLAQFERRRRAHAGEVVLGADSLLPCAAQRCETIGSWLLDHGAHLGDDARRLLEGLLSRRSHVSPTPSLPPTAAEVAAWDAPDGSAAVRATAVGGRTLVLLRSQPPTIFWLDNAGPSS